MGIRHRALTEWPPQLGSAFANEKVEKINAKAIAVNLAMERSSAIAHQLGGNSASPVRRKLGEPGHGYWEPSRGALLSRRYHVGAGGGAGLEPDANPRSRVVSSPP